MKLIGLMPVRNEDWVLGLSARVALEWCDELVVYLHACEDQSEAIVRDVYHETKRVRFMHSFDPRWDEMSQRQHLLNIARAAAATHIAMIDADEVLTANLLEYKHAKSDRTKVLIREFVEQLAPGQMLELPGYNLRGSLDRYHSNGIWGDRWFSCAFKDQPEAHWSGDGFHHREPHGVAWKAWRPIQQGEAGILHLWGASERRLRAKHALYKVVERLRFPGKRVAAIDDLYSLAFIQKEPWKFKSVPQEWWSFHPETMEAYYRGNDLVHNYVELDGEPWQEAGVRRLIQEHGREKFQGLDLFGVV